MAEQVQQALQTPDALGAMAGAALGQMRGLQMTGGVKIVSAVGGLEG